MPKTAIALFAFLLVQVAAAGLDADDARGRLFQPEEQAAPSLSEGGGDAGPSGGALASSRIHLDVDLTYTSQYFFRGILEESGGFIFQPGVELAVELAEWDNGIALTGKIGGWSSFHDRRTSSTSSDEFISTWYEFDFSAGLGLAFGRLTVDGTYVLYTSPNGAFDNVDEIDIKFSYDDSDQMFEGFAFSPYAQLAIEIGSSEADGGRNLGTFLGIGIEPSYTLDTPVGGLTLSAPMEAGFSLADYYEDAAGDDDGFGYFQVGAVGSLALPVPSGYGAWSLHVGTTFLVLGDSTRAINNGDNTEWIFTIGLSASF